MGQRNRYIDSLIINRKNPLKASLVDNIDYYKCHSLTHNRCWFENPNSRNIIIYMRMAGREMSGYDLDIDPTAFAGLNFNLSSFHKNELLSNLKGDCLLSYSLFYHKYMEK